MVEEMTEEVRTETYDNYKFMTIPELKSLSLGHLVGKTNLLRPYMHGYFVASKLYEQARLIANPYVWEEERAKRIKEKVEKERASRIRGNKKVKVNQKLVDKILKRQEKRDKIDNGAGVLGDERFAQLFEDEEFAVDETSREFAALNPSTKVPGKPEPPTVNGGLQTRREYDDRDHGDSDQGSSESDQALSSKNRGDILMRVSSSASGRGSKPANDTSLGSRKHGAGRINKTRQSDVVGEKQVTFVPERKNKERRPQSVLATKRSDPRRSASTNTFRRL